MNIKMNYQKHCLVTSKNQRKTFSQQVPKWDIEGVQSFNSFIKKLFGKKDIKPIQKQKQIKMKNLKLFPILKESKKKKNH